MWVYEQPLDVTRLINTLFGWSLAGHQCIPYFIWWRRWCPDNFAASISHHSRSMTGYCCCLLQVKVTLHWILEGVGLGFNQAVWKWCYYLTEMGRLWFLVKRFMIKLTVWFARSVSVSYFRVPYKMYMLCRSLCTVDKLWIFTKWKQRKAGNENILIEYIKLRRFLFIYSPLQFIAFLLYGWL